MSGGSFLFLTLAEANPGFSLAGFRQQAVSVAEAEAALQAILAEGGTHLVVVDERLLHGIDPDHFWEMGQRYEGALAVLPGPGVGSGEFDYAEHLVARAVGYQLRLSAESAT